MKEIMREIQRRREPPEIDPTNLSKEAFNAWCESPVTKEIFRYIFQYREYMKELSMSKCPTVEAAAMLQMTTSGVIQAFDYILDIQYDEDEEEISRDAN